MRCSPNRQRGVAGRGGGGQVDGAEPVALRQEQLGRAEVLADRAHVLPRGRGRLDLGDVVLPVQLLAHDDRVAALGQRVTGVDDAKGGDLARGGLGGPEGVRGSHRDAVHGGRVVGG